MTDEPKPVRLPCGCPIHCHCSCSQPCPCGEPEADGVHRIDGPCYQDEQPATIEPIKVPIICYPSTDEVIAWRKRITEAINEIRRG